MKNYRVKARFTRYASISIKANSIEDANKIARRKAYDLTPFCMDFGEWDSVSSEDFYFDDIEYIEDEDSDEYWEPE